MDSEGIAARIKALRGRLSQREFAILLDVGQTYISEVETCRRPLSISLLYKISNFCGVTTDYILKGSKGSPAFNKNPDPADPPSSPHKYTLKSLAQDMADIKEELLSFKLERIEDKKASKNRAA